MMRIKTAVAFSGVPAGTKGYAERDGKLWKITWEMNLTRPLVDWFSDDEFKQYLTEV